MVRRSLPPLALAFCAGTALRLFVGLPTELVVVAMVFLVGGLVAARDVPRASHVLALLLAASAGILHTASWSRLPPSSVANLSDRRWARLHGTVVSLPESVPGGVGFDMDVRRAETRREPLKAVGRVRVYATTGMATGVGYGDNVEVEGRVTLPDDAGNPGEIPPARYLRRSGVVAVITADGLLPEPGRGGNPVVAAALRCRRAMERGINASLSAPEAGLLRGLLFSDTSALPESSREDFRRSGTVHVLSTSGIHVALLAGLAGLFWKAKSPKGRRRRAIGLLLALIFFVLMTGLRPAVVRAVVMTGAVLAAPIFDREADVWSGLALAALALVVASPLNLLDPGFRLSFATALGIAIWWDGRRHTPIVGPVQWLNAALQTSIVASVVTAPLALRTFGETSVAGPVTNLLVIPLVGPAMALGLVQGMAWPWAMPVVSVAAFLNHIVLSVMLWVMHQVGAWSWPVLQAGAITNMEIVALYAATGLILWKRLQAPTWRAPAWRPGYFAAVCAAAPLFLAWRAWGPGPPLRVTFVDVGQGDCALIQTPMGRNILVDAGGRYEDGRQRVSDAGDEIVLPVLRRAGVDHLDLVVLTHPHEDHAGGLPAVFRALPVGLWLDSGQPHAAPGYTASLRLARARGIRYHVATAGERVDIEPGIALDVLAPFSPPLTGTGDDLNNNSIVFRLTCGHASFLFCGDAGEEAEARLLLSGAGLASTVLKVGHHGSATSSSAAFLAAVQARLAVISCGRHNRYGHPADATLARLHAAGASVYRTDEDGGIVMSTRGNAVRVETSRWSVP